MKAVKSSAELLRELDFERKLCSLLNEYGYDLRKVIDILEPGFFCKQLRKRGRCSVVLNPVS